MKNIIVLLLSFCLAGTALAQKKNLDIVFIGNSITYGAGLSTPSLEAPPVKAAEYLKRKPDIDNVAISNQGHSGYTTLDFLPGTAAFKQVEYAGHNAKPDALLIFSLKLGTNDSAIQGTHGAPVSVDDYRTNLKAIVDSLLHEFPKSVVIINHPVWYSPNTYNGAKYLQEGLDRLQTYIPVIDALAAQYQNNGQHVYVGDTEAFDYFKANYLTDLQPEQGNAGTFYLHPNAKGAKALGEFWGKAIYKCIK